MELRYNKKHKCKICEKEITENTPYIGSHVQRSHGISIQMYASLYYTETEKQQERNCVSCGKKIIPKILFDFEENTFKKMYDGYLCINTRKTPSFECKDNISNIVLGTPFNKKIYEHIGSKKEYLSLKYQISEDEAIKLKNVNIEKIRKENPNVSNLEVEKIFSEKIKTRNSKPVNNLNGFIERHGEDLGRILYNENCQKIGRSNTLDYYIEKYGDLEGMKRWSNRSNGFRKSLGPSVSKASKKLETKFDLLNLNYITEYPIRIGRRGIVSDFYLPDFDVVIEFFGDYWHCNPKFYDGNYYHKILKTTASEKWEFDKKRIDEILELSGSSVLVIWESTEISETEILSIIKEIKGKNTLFII